MKNFICVVFGRKGSGKTTLLRRANTHLDRVIVLDPLCEYSSGVVIGDSASLASYLRENHDKKFRVIFRADSDEEYEQAFLCASNMYTCTIIVEEIDMYCSPYDIVAPLNQIIRYGRHKQISILGASRRAAEVSRHLTAQADCIVSFLQTEPRDIQYMKSKLSTEQTEELKNLGQYEYRVFGDIASFQEFFGFAPEFTRKALTTENPPLSS